LFQLTALYITLGWGIEEKHPEKVVLDANNILLVFCASGVPTEPVAERLVTALSRRRLYSFIAGEKRHHSKCETGSLPILSALSSAALKSFFLSVQVDCFACAAQSIKPIRTFSG
jgi:hypothetical protein